MDARGAIGARVVGMDLPDLRHRPLFLDGSFGAGVCSGPVLVAAGAGDAEDPAVRFTPNAPLGFSGRDHRTDAGPKRAYSLCLAP
ncbi:hypothetical protein GCM10010510_67300 [Streptomyces anandii JCM 4720]|nr:hypothetical protein GCM10010510_67300 [Streptomyces anandii JCM 4720]